MARKFNFTISADNNPALKAIRAVNRELYKINKPFRDMGSAIRAFGRESGFKNMVSGFKATADAASDVAGKIAGILTPLVAVTGFGSIAGIAEMATNWGSLARSIELTKYQTGASEQAIQSWIGAGKLFGVTTEQVTGTINSFSSAIQDAVYGRNQGLYNTLGMVGVKDLHERLGDPTGVLKDFADKIQKYTPLARHKAIMDANLGGIEPMLMDGSAGLERALATNKKYGYSQTDEEIKKGKEFAFTLFEAQTAVSGLANKIGADLVPVLGPLVQEFTTWVTENRDLISQNVTEFVQGFADVLKQINFKEVVSGIKDFLHGVKQVVDFLGGWRNAILALMIVMSAPLIAAVGQLAFAVGGFAVSMMLLAPEVFIVVGALVALYEIKEKLFNQDKRSKPETFAESIEKWKGRLGFGGDALASGGATPVSGGMSYIPKSFAFPGGMSYPMNSDGGGNSAGDMSINASSLDPNSPAPMTLAGSIPAPMRGSSDITVTFDNLPAGAKTDVKAKNMSPPSVNIFHSVPLSSGINP